MNRLSVAFRVFALLCVLCIPFPLLVFPFISDFQSLVFGSLSTKALDLFHVSYFFSDLSSDTLGLYTLVFMLAVLGLLSSFFWSAFIREKITSDFTRKVLRVFLAFVLIRYGLDKLLLLQFPEPGPNLLLTQLGEQDRDIVFWSLMGVSPLYVIVTGMVELVCGILLLFRKTQFSAAILSIFVFAHIVFINFGFDISVKLFSSLLTLFSLYLALPALKPLWKLLSGQEFESNYKVQTSKLTFLKWMVLILCTVEGILLLSAKLDRDDLLKMSAYEVTSTEGPVQRVYFHSDGFLILENKDHERTTIEVLDKNGDEILVEFDDKVQKLHFLENGTKAILSMPFEEESELELRKLSLENLSFTNSNFHWTVDELIRQ